MAGAVTAGGLAVQRPTPEPVESIDGLRSVRGPGIATMVLIGVVGLLDAVDLPLVVRIWSWFDQILAGVDVPITDLEGIDELRASFGWLQIAAYVAAGVLFLVWFYRVRINTGLLNPSEPRRGPGWAIGGWFCPVVNLWFPVQIMFDAVRSVPAWATGRRPGGALVGWWWGLWLAGLVMNRIVAATDDPDTMPEVRRWLTMLVAMDAVGVVSAVLAIVLVARLTAVQQGIYLRSPASLPVTTW